jgi:hypothetical protein
MPDNRTRVEHQVCELMNGSVVFSEIPDDGDTYVYTHEGVEYNFIFDTDHWKLVKE